MDERNVTILRRVTKLQHKKMVYAEARLARLLHILRSFEIDFLK